MNLPNKLTIARVIMIPLFLICLYLNIGCGKYIAVGIFILASLTDLLDCKIARKYNLVTNFGKFMDPVASDNGVVIAASYWGKFKTAFQMITIIMLVLNLNVPFMNIINTVLIYISLGLTVISLIDYIAKNYKVFLEGSGK